MDIDLTIRGLQAAQANNNRRMAMLQRGGVFGRLVKEIAIFTPRRSK